MPLNLKKKLFQNCITFRGSAGFALLEAHGHNYCCGGPGPHYVKLTVMNVGIYINDIDIGRPIGIKLQRSRYIRPKNVVKSYNI